jgi:signal transduction histidine kinase
MTASILSRANWKKRFRRYLDRVVEQNWINIGLRTKMGAIVAVGLFGLFTIFAVLGISTTSQATGQVLNERVMLTHLSADNLDATLHHIESILTAIAGQEALRNPQTSPAERDAALRTGFDLIPISSEGEGIYLFDPTGRLLTSATEVTGNIDWSEVTVVQEALEGKRSSLSILTEGEQPWLTIAVPIFDDSAAQPIGALTALLNLTNPAISPFEHPFELGQTGIFDVVDANGLVLISTHPERVLTISDQADLLSELFVAGKPTVETCVGCEAEESPKDQVMAFAPMSQAPWGVTVHQDSDEVFAPVGRLKLLTFLLGLAAVTGAALLVWLTTSSVIDPVQLLTDAAKRIARGDLATPVCCQRGDEIGELAESFDAMRAQLKNSMDEIRAWNRELDARVQERTQAALVAQFEAQRARDDLRAIIDGLSDALIVVGADDLRIQQVNEAAQARCPNDQNIIGQTCYEVFHRGRLCQPPNCECPVPTVLESGKSVKVTHAHHDPDNGHKRYLDIVASPMYDSEGHVTRVIELMRDVTEEKKIEESLVRRNQQLSILNAIATTVNQSLELEDILGKALDEVLRLTGVDVGAIFLQEETLGHLELLAHRGFSKEAAHLASRLGMLDGPCGGVIEAGQIIVIPDLSRYRGQRAESLRREELSTLVHVPLAAKGCVLGSMCVATKQQREFDEPEQELLNAIGNQIAVTIENVRLYAEVQQKEQLRGQLLNRLITAQEEERKRIARELHDDTSQALTALLYAVEETLDMNALDEMKERLAGMKELTVHTLDGVHKLIFDLRPTMLDHLGLVPALRWCAQSRLEPTGVRVRIEEASASRRLPADVETALFRIVQELITNIARHAAARNVDILLQFDEETSAVTVEDDGIGFDIVEVTLSPETGRGLGLMGMLERIELLGGEMDISTAPGYGTKIHITVPLYPTPEEYPAKAATPEALSPREGLVHA